MTQALLGRARGGLAIVSLVACALFTAFTGASGVTIVALGALLYPALLRADYPERFSLGLVTTSGSLGLLFPPSLVVILYAVIAQIPVPDMFVAGILLLTYLISLGAGRSLFKLGIWSFTGFAALLPVVLAALFWKASTKHGVVASILSVVVLWLVFLSRGWSTPGYTVAGSGIMPVAVMLVVSGLVLVVVSLLTPRPDPAVVDRFFPSAKPDAPRE